jgi:opacity protein-like surface antigen
MPRNTPESIFKRGLITLSLILLTTIGSLFWDPTSVWAEVYVGLYVGSNFGLNTNPRWEARKYQGKEIRPQSAPITDPYPLGIGSGTFPPLTFPAFTAHNISIEPSVMVGGKFGYWFSREGALKANYPSFMKYFGLEIDISYHPLNWGRQGVVISPVGYPMQIKNDGCMVTAAFLVMGRYGFLPDKEVPFGRLQPYLGIGPTIVFTKTNLNIGRDYQSSEGDFGFMVETGLRYMLWKNVSINPEFKYRYLQAHVDADDTVFGIPYGLYAPMATTYNLFSFTLGVAYHF